MTIEQTVTIPANRRLTIDFPQEFPVGETILTFTPVSAKRERMTPREAIEKCSGIAKGILSSDDILEMRRKDKELEDAQYRRLFSIDEDEH